MIKLFSTLLALLLSYPVYAFELGAGLSTSAHNSGGWGRIRWDFRDAGNFTPGLFAKFTQLRTNNIDLNNNLDFRQAISERVDVGGTLSRQRGAVQGFAALGIGLLMPDKALRDSTSTGGVLALGVNALVDDRIGFTLEHSMHFGFADATAIPGSPNVFNGTTISSGIIMRL
jgi:hypothetical protein